MHIACMPNIQVRGVPDDVHAALVRKAKQRGQSLQQYLAEELGHLAVTPTPEEFWDRVGRRVGGRLSREDAVAAIHEARAERDLQLRR